MKQSYLIAAGCISDRQNYRVRKASRRALVHCNLPGIRACHVVPAAQLQRYGHQHGVAPEGRQGDREPESGELHEGRQQHGFAESPRQSGDYSTKGHKLVTRQESGLAS